MIPNFFVQYISMHKQNIEIHPFKLKILLGKNILSALFCDLSALCCDQEDCYAIGVCHQNYKEQRAQ